ncbi:MAG: ComEC/Rec2 family competence protein, partial [Bacteroidota bacterium]|nr:ComEC/Rec2 family competence protein [Bacteroidota bacterium]
SAVTFSFITTGMFINRKTNIYNTLAASAFCLLVFNPFLLWDVGFQLSYAAVLSILLFTKPIYNCLYFQNKFLGKLWQLSCVNIAAQIFTLPIVLYYFHQFPLLFLFNNLLVIPLSEIILFILLFLVVISKVSLLASLAGKSAGALLWWMNSIIEHTAKLPFSLLSNIKVDVAQALLLYIIILLLAVWLLYKLPRFFVYALSLFLVFVIYVSVDVWRAGHQHKLIVYNISQHTAIDFISGSSKVCFCDSFLQKDAEANNFYMKPARIALRVKNDSDQLLSFNNNWTIQSSQKTILIVSQPLSALVLHKKIKADVVIITNGAKMLMSDLQKAVDCSWVVADNSISLRKIKEWKQDCDSLQVRFHSISQNGALVMDW